MNTIKKECIVDIFELCSEYLVELKTGKSIDVEEVSGVDYNTLMDMFCDEVYNPIRLYTKFVELWGNEDSDYEIVLSDDDSNNTLKLFTCLRDDAITIKRVHKFTPTDIFNIISAINSQQQFYDLFIGFNNGIDCTSTIYHGESFAVYKHWIEDIMIMFKNEEINKYSSVTLTSDPYYTDMIAENVVRDNRLYVIFENNR